MQSDVEWTEEQEKVLAQMLKESENIGFTQGWDESIKSVIEDLRKKLYIKEE